MTRRWYDGRHAWTWDPATGRVTKDREPISEDSQEAARVRVHFQRADRRAAARRATNEAMRSIGMVKVRGNLGGTYWE